MDRFYKYALIVVFSSILLSACATLSKDECKTANWYDIGYADGTLGYPASRIAKHRTACAEYAIRPDLSSYNSGRAKGLHEYCIPANGYNKGLSGVAHNGICSGYGEGQFLRAYGVGKEIFRENAKLNNMKNDYITQQEHYASLEAKLKKNEKLLLNGKLPTVEALLVFNEAKDLAVELAAVKENLHVLQSQIDEQASHVERLYEQHQY